MDLSDGFVLIDFLKKIGTDDIPYALKVLQTTHDKKSIAFWFNSLEDRNRTEFIQCAVECYLQVVSSAKLARSFFKILMSVPVDDQKRIENELETCFEALINRGSSDGVKKLCELLNVSPVAKQTCKKFITPISSLVVEQLNVFTRTSFELKGRQDWDTLYHTLKICIHCLQSCSGYLRECLFEKDRESDHASNDLKSMWSTIFDCLLSMLFQNASQDLLGLAGTAISMILNLSPSSSESSIACKEILQVIYTEKKAVSVFHILFEKPQASLSLSSEDKDLRVLMLIKGLLQTSSKELLCCSNTDGQSLLSYIFPFILRPCRGPQIHHYIAFQMLTLWFQKLKVVGIRYLTMQFDNSGVQDDYKFSDNEIDINNRDTVPECPGLSKERSMSSSCPVLTSTLSAIWLNWESPVDGVSEYVTTIFDCLLNIWAQAVKEGVSNYSELSGMLMERLLIMSWHTKTRYRPLSILVPYVDVIQLLRAHPELKEDLTKCMNVNVLAAVASDAYKAFLTQIKVQAENDTLSVWCDLWMSTLIRGITSSNPIQRSKICTYWIPHSLKLIQGSHAALLETLQNDLNDHRHGRNIENLLAWTTVCRHSRDILGMAIEEQHYNYVKQALVCIDDDVRGEAMFLMCNTLKRATPVSNIEIELLKSFISVNLKTDSTSLRQNMVSALKKLIVRIRDSCLSEVRSQNFCSDILTSGIGFIDWLFNTLLQNLCPGGTYQRRQTALDLLEAIFSLLVFQEQHCSKKGKAQEGSGILIDFAKKSGRWMFFREESFLVLLSCLEDGSDDIQTQCYQLLEEFFPWPDSSLWESSQGQHCSDSEKTPLMILTDTKTVCCMINKALDLASSPKSYETHSGLLLMSLVLKKYVQNVGLVFTIESHCKVSEVYSIDEDSSVKVCPTLTFLDMLMDFLETSVSTAKRDPAGQFKFHPIHGLTQYTTHCIKEIFSQSSGDKNNVDISLGKYLERLKDLNKEIINLMLDILSGGGNLDQCPSFAEMGVALESLISGDEEPQENVTTLSPDFQLLLSWCWINLKESCTSLGQVTASAVKGDTCFLSSAVISDIRDVFVRVLTTCRHRGAIEGCRTGFSMFCEVLLSCKLDEYSSLPKSMLTTILQSLLSNSLTASISRRSAGLPIIVEVVANQVIRICNDKQFLKSTVDEFYSVASQPITTDHSQQRDLSQVHAFNILKAVFCDANLASYLGPLLSKLTILVIENFDSPSWAIRNAATQLISTLVMRIFGQRNKSSGSTTLEEFNSLHPELVQYIINKLQKLSSTRNVINPSLYVLLTLLSNLVMSPSHLHDFEGRNVLQSLLVNYLDNPVYSLRSLSAKACVALFQLDQADEELDNHLTDLIHTRKSLNYQHGHLLCVYHLISSDALSKSTYLRALKFFCVNKTLLSPSLSCLLPSTQVVLIIQKLLQKCHGEVPKETCAELWSHLEGLFSLLCKHTDEVQAGAATCKREILITMTLIVTKCQDLCTPMVKLICSSITSPNRDVHEAVISLLHDEPFQGYLEDATIWETLWRSLVTETRTPVFVQSCDILYRMCDRSTRVYDVPKDLFCGKDLSKKWAQIDSVKSSILILEGIVYSTTESSDLSDRYGAIQEWCDDIVHFSKPFMNENLRLSAARALRKGGSNILDMCRQNPSHIALENIVISIVKAAIQFLEDSETNVREEVSVFVSGLMNVPRVHSNLALQMLSQYISQNIHCSGGVYLHLLEDLYVCGDLTAQCKNVFSSGLQRLFEPEKESILLELHAKKIWAFKTMKTLSGSNGSNVLEQLKQKSSEAAKELNENLTKLTVDLRGFLFNASNKPRVMACLLGLVLLDKLCQDIMHTADDLHRLVQQLLKVPYLHPLLRCACD